MKKILQLSVLDAVIHPRMYYKYARSFAKLGFEVKVVGEKKHDNFSPEKNISIEALPPIAPTAWARLQRQWHLWQIAWAYQPQILMIHAVELTFFAFLYKKLRPQTYIIYDVFEDYAKNLFYNPLLSPVKKKIIYFMLRPLEIFFAKYFDSVCYAENCYDNILNIPPEKKHIFLNKFSSQAVEKVANLPLPDLPYMLYTGTLEENWGVLETIDMWIAMNQIKPLHLIIAGFTYHQKMVQQIKEKVEKSNLQAFFTLYGGNEYVSYDKILFLIKNSYFGTALYKMTPSIVGKIPTKFFEYCYLGKPLLFTSESLWDKLNNELGFGISVKMEDIPSLLLEKVDNYTISANKEAADWDSYLDSLQKLTNHV